MTRASGTRTDPHPGGAFLEHTLRPRHSQRSVDDDLKASLDESPGAWKLLETPAGLLMALRDRASGLFPQLKTVLRPDRALLAGDLAEMQPSDLLNFLHQGRRTGVLLTRSDGVERGIVLLEGNVAWACSTRAGERLGELLCRMGLADRASIQQALRAQRGLLEKRRLGQLLVEGGVF